MGENSKEYLRLFTGGMQLSLHLSQIFQLNESDIRETRWPLFDVR